MKLNATFFGFLFAILMLAGCATAPQKNYSGDIDSLNSRVFSLQSELAAKDAEIARLHSEAGSQSAALKQAENDRDDLNRKLDALASQPKPTPTPDLK